MMRRSKLKVRPAIRKSQSSSQDANKTEAKTTTEVLVPTLPKADDKEHTPVAITTKQHDQPPIQDINHTKSEKQMLSLLNENSVPKLRSTAEINEPKENTNNKSTAPIARRRKLVACPMMAKKRKTIVNESITKHKPKALEPIEKTVISVQEKNPDIDPISSTQVDNIQMSVTPLPQSDEPLAGVESATLTLTPVTASLFLEDSAEVSVGNDAHVVDSPNDVATDSINIDSELTLTDGKRSEHHVINDQEVLNYDCVLLKSAQETAPVFERKVTECKPKNCNPKATSISEIHRRNAMEKLKKLKENQEDESEWPELDQNLVSMSDLIFLNPPNKIGLTLGMNAEREKAEEELLARKNEQASVIQPPEPEKSPTPKDEKDDAPLPVPQIRIADDGSVVIDEESIVLDTQKPVDPKISTVYEFGKEGKINQCSFLRRPIPRPQRWSEVQTNKFYKCLCIVGAEFSLMGAMFRERSADDLRRKFKRERKKNPNRVDQALMQQHLSKWTDEMFEPKEKNDESKNSDTNPKNVEGSVT